MPLNVHQVDISAQSKKKQPPTLLVIRLNTAAGATVLEVMIPQPQGVCATCDQGAPCQQGYVHFMDAWVGSDVADTAGNGSGSSSGSASGSGNGTGTYTGTFNGFPNATGPGFRTNGSSFLNLTGKNFRRTNGSAGPDDEDIAINDAATDLVADLGLADAGYVPSTM